MSDRAALAFFLEDCRRLGISEAEYERRFGVILRSGDFSPSAAAQRIRRNEVSGGLMSEDDLRSAALAESIRRELDQDDWEAQKEAGGK
jgi:hypothetical protein